jgi:predicted metal-dependent hydrolase
MKPRQQDWAMVMVKELPFEYTVVRSRRKSVAVYIRDGRAEVRAPMRAPNYFIQNFLLEKSAWIQQQIIEEAARDRQRYRLHNGAELSFLGEAMPVVYHDKSSSLQDGTLMLLQGKDEETTLKNFDIWLKKQAEDTMTPLAHEIAAEIGVQQKLQRVRYRKTKTNWGHCTAKGILQFNPLTMLAPFEVVAYLVCHEVSHLRHMNHSKQFWALVESVCPDYKQCRKWMREHGDILMGLHH